MSTCQDAQDCQYLKNRMRTSKFPSTEFCKSDILCNSPKYAEARRHVNSQQVNKRQKKADIAYITSVHAEWQNLVKLAWL